MLWASFEWLTWESSSSTAVEAFTQCYSCYCIHQQPQTTAKNQRKHSYWRKNGFLCAAQIDVVDVCSFCWSERVLSKHHKSDVSLAKFRQTANESYQILIMIAETRLELKSRRVERFIGDGSESFWAFRGFRSMKRWMPKSIIVTTHEEYCTRKLFLLCLDLL